MFGVIERPRVLVLGLGESGLAMTQWCLRHGGRVRVADTRATPPGLDALDTPMRSSAGRAVPDTLDRSSAGGDAPGAPAVEFISGPLSAALLDGIELVALSPGLSPRADAVAAILDAATARSIPVWGEIEFFAHALAHLRGTGYAPKVLAITGTNGKTTTTALTAVLCRRAGKTATVAGNISPALLTALAQALDADRLPDVWVLELSSFQLDGARTFAPDAAALLNITQDHLDWHGGFEAYAAAKAHIFGPSTVRVLNRDDPATMACATAGVKVITFGIEPPAISGDFGLEHDAGMAWLAQAQDDTETDGAGAAAGVRASAGVNASASASGSAGTTAGAPRRRKAVTVAPPVVRRLMPADALHIRGLHNAANAMAALALCRAIDLPLAQLLHGLRDYQGEPHRVETIATLHDIDYIDDSKGTNVGATVAALDGLAQRTILIAGGDGKGQDFAPLAKPVARWCRAVLLIGADAPRLRAALAATGVTLHDAPDLDAATRAAAALAQPGDAVLLSPACASFDMFNDYKHRADTFRRAVEALAADSGVIL